MGIAKHPIMRLEDMKYCILVNAIGGGLRIGNTLYRDIW